MKLKFGFGAVIASAIGLVLLLLWLRYKDTAKKFVSETINPLSDQNIVNRGVSKIVQKTTGEPDATLGTKLYDWIDALKDVIPGWESESERFERIKQETMKRIPASVSSSNETVKNPSILVRLPNVAGDQFE
jgi:hypothetical protein